MNFIKNLLAIIISFSYFIILLIMGTLLVLSNVFSGDYYTKILQDIDFSEVKISDFGINNVEKDMTVEEVLVDTLKEAGVSSSDAKKIANSNKIKEIAGRIIGESTIYLVEQEKLPQISVSEVKSLLEDKEFSEIVGEIPTDMNAEEITNELNKLIKELLEGEVSNGK